MLNTYFIGGSPCAGKSTAAEILAKKFDLFYFKVDDYLDHYTKLATAKECPICQKTLTSTAEEIWMRDAALQCEEEFQYYRELFPFIINDLKQIACTRSVVTEGAAYVPNLIKSLRIPANRYLALTPTPEFQISHFRERDFVPYVLEGCQDKERAFENWMNRDILFAKEVRRQCAAENFLSITNDGTITVEQLVQTISAHFLL